MEFKRIIPQGLVTMVGVFLAAQLLPGIHCETTGTLIAVVLLLGLLNAILRPLLILFALPFVVFTLGFGILLINGLLFLLVDKLVPGFVVDGYGSAFWGALLVSVIGTVANALFGLREVKVQVHGSSVSGLAPSDTSTHKRQTIKDDDVIDI